MPVAPTTAIECPILSARTQRAVDVAAAARTILEAEGSGAVTMRRVAESLGIKAPSLYKHFPDKGALEAALIEDALAEMGAVLHAALARPGRHAPVAALLAAYRTEALAHPNLYRLATAGQLPRGELPAGLEAWAGEPFFLVTGEAHLAQALWSFAHGMVILEIDGRFPDSSDLDSTWRAGADAFSRPPSTARAAASAPAATG